MGTRELQDRREIWVLHLSRNQLGLIVVRQVLTLTTVKNRYGRVDAPTQKHGAFFAHCHWRQHASGRF